MADPSDNKTGSPESSVNPPKDTDENVSAELKSAAQETKETVSCEAAVYAGQAKETVVKEVGGVESALRTAAAELRRGSPQERAFGLVADALADAAEAVRDKHPVEIVASVGDMARRHPLVFLSGAALLGFTATRFLKASSRRAAEAEDDVGMDRPPPGSRALLDQSFTPVRNLTSPLRNGRNQ